MKTTILITTIILITSLTYSQVPPPTLQQGEYWTQLFSAGYDYQTNGSIRYIIQNSANPNGLCAVLMAQQDSSVSSSNTSRYIYYSYSSNGGRNWTKNVIDTISLWGYPCIATRNGIPIIAMHTNFSFPQQRTCVFSDASFGGSTFTQINGIPSNQVIQWPHITSSSNGNITVAGGAPQAFSIYYSTFNGTSWLPLTQLINTEGSSGLLSTESGPGGAVYIFGTNNNVLDVTKLWTSSDNGLSFTLQTGNNAPPSYILSGNDTLYAYIMGGKSGIYVGSEVHLVYSVYASSSEGGLILETPFWVKKNKIIHWSPSTGIDTIAGRFNIPNLTDTILTNLMAPLCQPSIGIFNGLLYCTFTTFLRGNTQTVNNGATLNAGEIFLSYSSDNGNTWSTPVNITNTPNIEEKHSSTIRNFISPANDSLGVYYLRDLKAGGWVNNAVWGKAPVYGIYKKLGASVIGIQQELEVVREFRLFQNYPNPFNPATTISYNLQKASFVTLKIYNVLGEEVKVLTNEEQPSGAKEISFDAGSLPSGVYFYTLTAGDFRDTKAMILLK